MTLKQRMMQTAKRGASEPGWDGRPLATFVLGRMRDDGGFAGRGEQSDLYYTLFAVQCLIALGWDVPAGTSDYLEGFGEGDGLDLVHLACLARCWSEVEPVRLDGTRGQKMLMHIEKFRTSDGGYAVSTSSTMGSVYGCFLAVGAHEDIVGHMDHITNPGGVLTCVSGLATGDGSYANGPFIPLGSTIATSAAVTLLRHLGADVHPLASDWLIRQGCPEGGFAAFSGATVCDLLSTATALHALDALGQPIDAIGEPARRFVESLRDESSGYRGTRDDPTPDCEYSFYALLARGFLKVV